VSNAVNFLQWGHNVLLADNRVAPSVYSAPSAVEYQRRSRKPQMAPRTQSYCFCDNTLIHHYLTFCWPRLAAVW